MKHSWSVFASDSFDGTGSHVDSYFSYECSRCGFVFRSECMLHDLSKLEEIDCDLELTVFVLTE